MIKILSGYHRPDAGQVYIAGKPMHLGSSESSHRLGCRVVHQDLGLGDDCYVRHQALKRGGQPPDLAEVVAFLSGPGSSFVYRQLIAADGGATGKLAWSETMGHRVGSRDEDQ